MPGPTCSPCSPMQKELTETLIKLHEQKDELETKLNGESCDPSPVEEELEKKRAELAEAKAKAERLKAIKAALEGKIQCLTGKSAERSSAIETLSQFAKSEKAKLQETFDQVTKVLQEETAGRIFAQEQIDAEDICPIDACALAAAIQATDICGIAAAPPQAFNYPYDESIERPARYAGEQWRKNPIRPIPFPNDAMDEAEAFGGCDYTPLN